MLAAWCTLDRSLGSKMKLPVYWSPPTASPTYSPFRHKHTLWRVCLLTLALSFCGIAGGQMKKESPTEDIRELEQKTRQVLERNKTPGAAIALVSRDRVLWMTAIGKADVASGRAATPDTLFRIASISKGFVALSVMMLVEEGKLSLDDPVRKLAPDVAFRNPWETTNPLRVVHLLEHTTGWDDLSPSEYAHNDPASLTLSRGLAFRPNRRISRWKPGSGFSYCNSGPAVAARIVERISGKRYEDFVAERIFQPLGMPTASYFLTPAVANRLATGYSADGKTQVRFWHLLLRPSGALNVSVREMSAYVRMHLNRGRYEHGVLVRPESIERIETPGSSLSARRGVKAGYGLCNTSFDYEGFTFHGHSGRMEGYSSRMSYLPDAGRGYVFMINSGDGKAAYEISQLLNAYLIGGLPKPQKSSEIPVEAGQLKAWEGYYEPLNPHQDFFHNLGRIDKVRLEDGYLRTWGLFGESGRKLIPVGGDRFRPEEATDADRVFLRDETGTRLTVIQGVAFRAVPGVAIWGGLVLGVLALLLLASTIPFALWWIVRSMLPHGRRPRCVALRIWPLVAALSLAGIELFLSRIDASVIPLMGRLSFYSGTLCALTIVFPTASVLGLASTWRFWRVAGMSLRVYSLLCSSAACLISAYLGYWDMLALQTWR
jgi:CubicO group peptidase (beta-lactamase class C family)